jgi:hypothetical protein
MALSIAASRRARRSSGHRLGLTGVSRVAGEDHLIASLGAADEIGQLAFGVGHGNAHRTLLPDH